MLNANKAFIGHRAKMSTITYRSDRNILIVNQSVMYRYAHLVPAFLLGPIPLVMWLCHPSLFGDANAPIYFREMFIGLMCVLCLVFITGLFRSRSAVFDFDKGMLILKMRNFALQTRTYPLSMIRHVTIRPVEGLKIEDAQNIPSNRIASYVLIIHYQDESDLIFCETTNYRIVNELVEIIRSKTSSI